jgi:hypothetical protein
MRTGILEVEMSNCWILEYIKQLSSLLNFHQKLLLIDFLEQQIKKSKPTHYGGRKHEVPKDAYFISNTDNDGKLHKL